MAVSSKAWRESGVICESRALAMASGSSPPPEPGFSSMFADDQMAWKVR
jgi:hypothetical protein